MLASLRVLNLVRPEKRRFVTSAMNSYSSAVHAENLKNCVFSLKGSRRKLNHSTLLESFFFSLHSFFFREKKLMLLYLRGLRNVSGNSPRKSAVDRITTHTHINMFKETSVSSRTMGLANVSLTKQDLCVSY